MNVVITGHKGLIGDALKKRLESEGDNIIKCVDLRENQNILDLENEKIDENVDIVFHLAAHCKINESITNPKKTFVNNTEGSFAVFEFCRKNNIKKIVFFSSSRVLSKEKNPYTASKIYGEELCRGYCDCYGIEYIIIRPSTVYGPFDDLTHRLVDIFIRSAIKGEDLVIYGDPDTKTLDFTYIDDFIDGVILTLQRKWNSDYNISGDEEVKILDLAKMIIELTNSKSKIVIKNPEIAQPQTVGIDISCLKEIGYEPKVPLREGINRCVNFYKELLNSSLNSL